MDKAQFGFRKGCGTRNASFMLRTVMERAVEKQKSLFMCFVDFEKAFDTARHEMLMDRMREIGVDAVDLRVLTNLYRGKKHW